MKICVLQPDYSTTDVDYKNYDPPRSLSKLLPNDIVEHIFLNKLTTYKQLKLLSKQHFDIYVNLCEGYLDWEIPSIDVIHSLELLNLPYTGPNASLYDPPKPLMKYVAHCAGINTPNYIEVNSVIGLESQLQGLSFPLFVKPAKAGDSLGIDEHSLVSDVAQLRYKINALLSEEYDEILVEEYVPGREFTVLVAANPTPDTTCSVCKPIEYIFPQGNTFKTYALKTSELHTDANIPCQDNVLEERLKSAAADIFTGFSGVGYARLDFRVNDTGEIFFLEINFTCSVFYEDGFEGSADYILNHDPIGKSGFLQHIIAEGIARHKAKQQKHIVKGNSINGYGIFAKQPFKKDDVIFQLEGTAQRIITKRYVDAHWTKTQMQDFKHYAYPISKEVYILWNENPQTWAPQNHSCQPNTGYDGLNVIALQAIDSGEELTLDYAELVDENMTPFNCTCGSSRCRKLITGIKDNSITSREAAKWEGQTT